MRQIFKNQQHQEDFIEKGYIKVPLLTPDEAAGLLEKLELLHPADRFTPDGTNEWNPATYHCTFLDENKEYKLEANELLSEVFQPLVDKYLEGYRIITSNFYIKPPGRGAIPIHQNWHMTPDIRDSTFTMWCPLVDVSPQNGTVKLVEGSHKIIPNIPTAKQAPFYDNFKDVLHENHLRPMSMKVGEGLIFDDHLIHGSDDNLSDYARIAIQIELIPEEVTAVHYHLDDEDPARFELIATDDDFYIQNSIMSVVMQPTHGAHFGYAPNPNRPLSVEEFEERLRRGSQIRRRLYGLEEGEPYADYLETPQEKENNNFWTRLRNRLRW